MFSPLREPKRHAPLRRTTRKSHCRERRMAKVFSKLA